MLSHVRRQVARSMRFRRMRRCFICLNCHRSETSISGVLSWETGKPSIRLYHWRFHSAMPTNLYGPGDNYHLQNSHVLPALIRKFHEAKTAGRAEVVAWGTGTPKREFLHVDDLADACAFLLKLDRPPDWINVGTGTDVTIRELTECVAAVTGFSGQIAWDATKPDGTPRKLMDVSRLAGLGWQAKIALREGVEKTYASFLAEQAAGVLRV